MYCFLVDSVGGREIWERDLEQLAAAGGKYAFFFRPKLRMVNLKLNYRNHRKLVTIDGRIGYIGGFNIGREYLGRKRNLDIGAILISAFSAAVCVI